MSCRGERVWALGFGLWASGFGLRAFSPFADFYASPKVAVVDRSHLVHSSRGGHFEAPRGSTFYPAIRAFRIATSGLTSRFIIGSLLYMEYSKTIHTGLCGYIKQLYC